MVSVPTSCQQLLTKDLDVFTPTLSFFSVCACIQMAMDMYYNVEYTIQETTCAKNTEAVAAAKCPLMECEFAVSCYFILS